MLPARSVTLFEHQSLAYADLPGFPQDLTARERFLDRIDQVNQLSGREILQANRKGLRAVEQVGVVRIGDLNIQILPKIDYSSDDSINTKTGSEHPKRAEQSAARNLLHMLACAHQIPVREQEIAALDTQPIQWFDLLTRLFAAGLYRQILAGVSHGYTVQEESLPVLRGRWDIQRQIRLHAQQQHLFDVTHDEFSADIPLNQIFRYVTHQLHALTQDTDNRLLLGDLMEWFQPVSELREIPTALLESIHFNRLNERFEPSFNLACLFLSGSAIRPALGSLAASAFIFDMNDLFERFIASFITRNRAAVLPQSWQNVAILPQSEGMRIFLAQSGSQPVARLRPDLLFKHRGESATTLIVDTKYKHLDPIQRKTGVAPDDLYQMLAYSVRLDCQRVLLLYPEPAGSRPVRKQLIIASTGAQFSICTVNLRTPLNKPDGLIQELKEILDRVVSTKSTSTSRQH